MNNILNKFKDWIIFWAWIVFVLWIVQAMDHSAITWESLTANKWNWLVNSVESNSWKLLWVSNIWGDIEVSWWIKSPIWNVYKPIEYAWAALPRSGTFTSNWWTLMVFASASAFLWSSWLLQIDIELDNVVEWTMKTFTNEGSSHKAISSDVIIIEWVPSGAHTIELVPVDSITNAGDFSHVTILELPF